MSNVAAPPPSAQLVIASHNRGKLREIALELASLKIHLVSAADLSLPEPEETASSFIGNAEIKAIAAMQATGLPALADDSGLCVHALEGKPGIFSARWSDANGCFDTAMERIHLMLNSAPDRSATFIAVLCLAWPNGNTEFVKGECSGTIVWPPRGKHGHGYDPIFVPDGATQTFAEMSENEKNAFSHRAKALSTFKNAYAPKLLVASEPDGGDNACA